MSEEIFRELSSPRFDEGSIVTEGISLWGKQPPFSEEMAYMMNPC